MGRQIDRSIDRQVNWRLVYYTLIKKQREREMYRQTGKLATGELYIDKEIERWIDRQINRQTGELTPGVLYIDK